MLGSEPERVIRAAIRSWPATLRLCLIVSVVAATSMIRVIRAAIRSWPATLRLCLIVSVGTATLAIVACLVAPSVLPLFTN